MSTLYQATAVYFKGAFPGTNVTQYLTARYVKVKLFLCKPQRNIKSGDTCSSSAVLGAEPSTSHPGCHRYQLKAEWAAEELWTLEKTKKIFQLPGFEARFHGRPAIGYPDLQEKMCHLLNGMNEKKSNRGLF